MPALNEIPAYRSFIKERDRAIESLINRAIAESNDLLRGALSAAVLTVLGQFDAMRRNPNPAQAIKHLDQMLDEVFGSLARGLAHVQSRVMFHVELLTKAGTAEALARVSKIKPEVQMTATRPTRNSRDEPIEGRARVTVAKFQRDLVDAVSASLWLEEDMDELKRRLWAALPEQRALKRPPRKLKPLQEANWFEDIENEDEGEVGIRAGTGGARFTFGGFMAEGEWRGLVKDVTDTYIPTNRGPEAVIEDAEGFKRELKKLMPDLTPASFENGSVELRYEWQYEQELAHELVRQTQTNEESTARKNGVTSFIWVAIIDDKTDDCCAWRDGLTVEEIADALQNEHSDDECQAFAPPAHFNCRCRLAPVLDAEDMKIESNQPEFDEWLTSV